MFTGGRAAHVGQLFFPEDLKARVEREWPYRTNTIPTVRNERDADAWAAGENGWDLFPNVSLYLSSSISLELSILSIS